MIDVKDGIVLRSDLFDATEYIPLNESDWNALSVKATELRTQKSRFEEAKKLAADMLKGVEAELDDVTATVARKKIMKAIKAVWEYDFGKDEKRLYQINEQTGENLYLRTSELNDDDRQLKLRFEKEQEEEMKEQADHAFNQEPQRV